MEKLIQPNKYFDDESEAREELKKRRQQDPNLNHLIEINIDDFVVCMTHWQEYSDRKMNSLLRRNGLFPLSNMYSCFNH